MAEHVVRDVAYHSRLSSTACGLEYVCCQLKSQSPADECLPLMLWAVTEFSSHCGLFAFFLLIALSFDGHVGRAAESFADSDSNG